MDSAQIAVMVSSILGLLAFVIFVVLAVTARIAAHSTDDAPFVVHVDHMN